MLKSNFFEKVGKLTLSIVLTWILATGIVIAGTTWNTYTDWDSLAWTEWWKMVDVINSKISLSDLTWYYTQEEVDTIVGWITSDPLILPSIKEKSVYFSTHGTKYSTCWAWEQVVSCWMGHDVWGHDDMFCKLDLSNNRCKLTVRKYNGMDNNTYWYCYCSYFKNWSWDSWTAVSHTSICTASKNSTTKSSWSCQPWAINYYYTWEKSCKYDILVKGELVLVPWFEYTWKSKQTCN